MSKFSQGEWKYCSPLGIVYCVGKRPIAKVINAQEKGEEREFVTETGKANARLIAAAPEMYELLRRVAYGSCDDCIPLMVSARELLARIDGKEDDHD